MANAPHLHSPSSILHPRPLCLAGPTAVGKSEVALLLAEQLNGEIVSVDSMQVYRGLDIGTAKPSKEERARVPHHLIDVADLSEAFDAAKFVALAGKAVADIQSRRRVPILCGGTGLYFKAYLEGLGEAPSADPKLRAELEALPLEELLRELADRDPATFEKIDRQNPRRVIRAVEVIRLTGKKFSEQRAQWKPAPADSATDVIHVLTRKPEDLHSRIGVRVDEMFRRGLVAETEQLLKHGLAENKTAMQALGYRQVVEHLRGERALAETIELVKIRTRQFAKRQLTWSRKADVWTQSTNGYVYVGVGVAYGNGTFVAVGGGRIVQSDPLVWLDQTAPNAFTISGPVDRAVSVQAASTILPTTSWKTVSSFTLTESPMLWTDPGPPAFSRRFYRVVLP